MLAKPHFVTPDWSNPINKGLVGWWTAPRAGTRVRNLVTGEGAALSTMNSGVTRVNSKYGSAFSGDGGANSYVDLGSTQRFLAAPTTPFTLMWMEKAAASPPHYAGMAAFFPGGGSQRFFVFRCTDTTMDNTHYGSISCGPGGISRAASWYDITNDLTANVGKWLLFIVQGSAGMGSGSFSDYQLWLNGQKYSGPTQGGGFSSQTTPFNQFGWDGADSKYLGMYDNMRLWNRLLTSNQAVAVSADPWLGGRQADEVLLRTGATGTLKTYNGLARAGIKTIDGIAIANVKTYDGLTS